MYQLLLIRTYLTSKVMPLLAALAVLLCTAMVIITWSVMGGFLQRLLDSGRTLAGDVIISWPNTGFAHYDELIEMLEKDSAVKAACPMIESYGLINLPDGKTETVIFRGVDGRQFAEVTDYARVLWWKPIDAPLRRDTERDDPRLGPGIPWAELYTNGLELRRTDESTGRRVPATVMGIQVSRLNYRDPKGYVVPIMGRRRGVEGKTTPLPLFLPRDGEVTVSVMPLDTRGNPIRAAGLEPVTRRVPVANEFFTGVYELDRRVVLLELNLLQSMLRMNAAERIADYDPLDVRIDPATGREIVAAPQVVAVDPARVTTVVVRGSGDRGTGEQARALAERCREIYANFAKAHEGEVPSSSSIMILTWEDQNSTLINAVRKETALVLFLFSFISLTAVFLVLAIFWSMVSERTKDVGTLRAIGASRAGIASLWIAYGGAIGLVGVAGGGTLAWLIVRNINPIHDWLGEKLKISIWDPSVYYFTEIPNRVDPTHAAIVMAGGVIAAAAGAIVPALRAAFMDPVQALRFE